MNFKPAETKGRREQRLAIGRDLVDRIYAKLEFDKSDDWRRDHLGASILGHKCDRYLWLSFRWALDPQHSGRQLRLFERGEREEAWLIENLRDVGVEVEGLDPKTGKQWSVNWGHVSGSADGVIPRPFRALFESKTHNEKSFDRVQQRGVKSAKPEHYTQMQVYMLGLNLDGGYYVAVCKNDDWLYIEWVDFDKPHALDAVCRGKAIVDLDQPPERMDKDYPPCVYTSKDGTRWECDFYRLCHGEAVPERNCRTCVESTPAFDVDGSPSFFCKRHQMHLPPEVQDGCAEQLTIPPILNAAVEAIDDTCREARYQFPSGKVYEEAPQE